MKKVIAVYGKRHQNRYLGAIGRFFDHLAANGFEIAVKRRFADYLGDEDFDLRSVSVVDQFPAGADIVVSIGGDGTFLRAAQWVGDSQIPVLGINTGHLGFLASYTFENIDQIVDSLIRGDFIKEERMVLKVEYGSLAPDKWHYALNEVAVLKSETSSMINVNAEINGFFLADYLSDGLIISTPTGSTAYNLSVGGPIIQPTLSCMTLSPVAPHSLTMRPLVVGGDSRLKLTVSSRASEFRLSIDGQSSVIPCGEEIKVSKASFKTCVLRIPEDDFASILRDKLLWGKR